MKNKNKNHRIDWDKYREKGCKDDGNEKLYPTLCGRYVSIYSTSIDDINDENNCIMCKALLATPLEIEISEEEITIKTKRDGIEVVHWVIDEWEEDPSILPCIANAIHMAHTKPDELIHINFKHMSDQYEMRKR